MTVSVSSTNIVKNFGVVQGNPLFTSPAKNPRARADSMLGVPRADGMVELSLGPVTHL